jgi:shikimate dehydrogenase
MKKANCKNACVIGWPIAHSRSPLIHGHWLKKYDIDGSYTKHAVRPEDLEKFVKNLAANGYAGCNVTVPHKEAAYALADVKDPSATAVGAANTLWFDAGKLHAANTDTYGFMAHLARSAPSRKPDNGPVAILGAGGAARAIAYGFLDAGAREIRVFNRSPQRAEALAQHFGLKVRALPWAQRSEMSRDCAALVNATTLGMKGAGDPSIDFAGFDPRAIVADIVYVPLETAFLATARAHGLKTVDGLGMLLHQAVPGFEKWFGVRPEVTRDLYNLIAADIAGA